MKLIDPEKRRSRSINITLTVLAVLVLGLFIAIGVLSYLDLTSQRVAYDEAERRLSNLKARDIPVDEVSLMRAYKSQTNPADGPAWMKIHEYIGSQAFRTQFKGIEPFYKLLASEARDNPVDQLTLKRRVVQQNAERLKTLHELASHREPVQLDLGFSLASSRDNLTSLRLLVGGLLTWEMEVALAENDSHKALQSLIAQFDTVSVAQGEHLTIDHMISAAAKTCIYENVRQLTQSNLLSKEQLEVVVSKLQSLPSDIQDWQRNVQSERAYLLPLFQRPFTEDNRPEGLPPEISHATAKDLAHFLNYMDRYESLNWSSWKTAKEALIEIDADLQRESTSGYLFDERNWRNTLLLIRHTPVLARTGWTHHAEYLAYCRSQQYRSIVACGLRLYKIKHGSFPDRLDQLVDVGIDSNQYLSIADIPFGYELKDNVAYLWGPIKNENEEYPFEIRPTIPQPPPHATPQELESINEALWTLNP